MSELISTVNWVERELDMFDAFEAGFQASGEGFNGEHVGRRFSQDPGLLRQELLQSFVEWRNR